MNSQLEDLKKYSIKFNRDFVKLSEYFLNPNGFDIAGPENNLTNNMVGFSNKFDNNNLLYDNNVIELARSGNTENELLIAARSKAKKPIRDKGN